MMRGMTGAHTYLPRDYWTPERKDQFRRDWMAGMFRKDIARKHGASESVISDAAKRFGFGPHPYLRKMLSADEIRTACAMGRDGKSIGEICRHLGRDRKQISKCLERYQIKKRQATQIAAAPKPTRPNDPYPAGHAATWSLISSEPYPGVLPVCTGPARNLQPSIGGIGSQ